MYLKCCVLVIAFLLLANNSQAQKKVDATEEIYVESWIVGNRIREQTLSFELDNSNNEQTAIVHDTGAGSYKLILDHFPAGKEEFRLEYWVVQLKPILSAEDRKEKLGENLLTTQKPGPGGDYFPMEDNIGYLYPRVAHKNVSEKIFDGRYYPIYSKRVVKVQNFYVLIRVNSFKMNTDNPKKLDSMNVTIEFRNAYNDSKDCPTPTPSTVP